MEKSNLDKIKSVIIKLLKEETYVDQNGELKVRTKSIPTDHVIDPNDSTPSFDHNAPPDLNIKTVKYHLQSEPLADKYKRVLYAQDAQVIKDPDHEKGVYSVYSPALKDYFDFTFNNPSYQDFTIISHT